FGFCSGVRELRYYLRKVLSADGTLSLSPSDRIHGPVIAFVMRDKVDSSGTSCSFDSGIMQSSSLL
ncbi:MAG: hypothetical protein PHD94_04465, partial [Synergistaceae bacterium]|nr:hypothetical protein [Synergistaceae bacterium]MDD5421313.1 hypothetical protein [Synergistaceae bacterium]